MERMVSNVINNYGMSKCLLMMLLYLALPHTLYAQQPVSVFITVGQSNADGRVYNNQLPSYLKKGYDYLHYTNVASSSNGKFEKRSFENLKERWAFCDVTNYYIERALESDFYSIKCTYGGTAIDTAATVKTQPVWFADSQWIANNKAYRGDVTIGRSLTKSLIDGFNDCVDSTFSRLKQGYDVKAIMWHQGESDRKSAGNYYENFKDVINYMRTNIYNKTGDESDKELPFIFGTVSRKSRQYSKGVEEAQRKVAAELPNVYLIDLSDMPLGKDVLHFDSAGTEALGKLMFEKLVQLKLVDCKAMKQKALRE